MISTDQYKKYFSSDKKKEISYAQNGEDIVLNRFFKKKSGFYVDVGAADPIVNSVTKLFYDKGWNGINIEPGDDYFLKLKTDRTRDINLQCGVGRKNENLDFFFCPSVPEWSTFSTEMAEKHRDEKVKFVKSKLKIQKLSTIFDENKVKTIDFLKIDAEGLEFEILQGNDWEKWRPHVLVIEGHEQTDWIQWIQDKQYSIRLFDGLNYFLSDTKLNVDVSELEIPANIIDNFVPYSIMSQISKLERENEDAAQAYSILRNRFDEQEKEFKEAYDDLKRAYDEKVLELKKVYST